MDLPMEPSFTAARALSRPKAGANSAEAVGNAAHKAQSAPLTTPTKAFAGSSGVPSARFTIRSAMEREQMKQAGTTDPQSLVGFAEDERDTHSRKTEESINRGRLKADDLAEAATQSTGHLRVNGIVSEGQSGVLITQGGQMLRPRGRSVLKEESTPNRSKSLGWRGTPEKPWKGRKGVQDLWAVTSVKRDNSLERATTTNSILARVQLYSSEKPEQTTSSEKEMISSKVIPNTYTQSFSSRVKQRVDQREAGENGIGTWKAEDISANQLSLKQVEKSVDVVPQYSWLVKSSGRPFSDTAIRQESPFLQKWSAMPYKGSKSDTFPRRNSEGRNATSLPFRTFSTVHSVNDQNDALTMKHDSLPAVKPKHMPSIRADTSPTTFLRDKPALTKDGSVEVDSSNGLSKPSRFAVLKMENENGKANKAFHGRENDEANSKTKPLKDEATRTNQPKLLRTKAVFERSPTLDWPLQTNPSKEIIPRGTHHEAKQSTSDQQRDCFKHGMPNMKQQDADVFKTQSRIQEIRSPLKKQEPDPMLNSVRSKIHRFESLCQESQAQSGPVLRTRRAFSVQEQPKEGFKGFSTIKDGETLLERSQMHGNVDENDLRRWTKRCLSVDEVALKRDGLVRNVGNEQTGLKQQQLGKNNNLSQKQTPETTVKQSHGPDAKPSELKEEQGPVNSLDQQCIFYSSALSSTAKNIDSVTASWSYKEDKPYTIPTDILNTPSFKDIHNIYPSSISKEKTSREASIAPSMHLAKTPFDEIPGSSGLTSTDTGIIPKYQEPFVEEDMDEEDDGTEKGDQSDYDSDSAESSVTITSNMSQSDRRSFSVSLADLCNFGGVDYNSYDDDYEESMSQKRASLSSDISAMSCVSLLPNEELDRLISDVRGLGDETLQNYEEVKVVVLHKEIGCGLGFTLAGGVDQTKAVTVHRVFPGGLADQEGSIHEGDQVLSINGTALKQCAHWEALRTLRKARSKATVVVVLQRGSVGKTHGNQSRHAQDEPDFQCQNKVGRIFRVVLQKSSTDLGFCLEGGLDSSQGNRPVVVKKVFQGGPLNDILPGDEILAINGCSVQGLRRLEVWTRIRKLPPGDVEVVLKRLF